MWDMMTFRFLITFLTVVASYVSAESKLSIGNAERLIQSIPDVLRNKHDGGCPRPECESLGENAVFCQVRNMCPKSGSGLIGNYRIDLRTGQIWSGIDPRSDKLIDSERLRRLRRQLLAKPRR